MFSVCLLPVLNFGRNWNKQICLQWHWQRLHSVLLLRHQDSHQHREEPQGQHREQHPDRVHALRLAVRRVCVCCAGGPGQGDHRPVHQEPGRVHEDLRQHQPVHDQDEGERRLISSQTQTVAKVPAETAQRVKTWCQFTWNTQKSFDEREILQYLPGKMMTDVALNIHFKTISGVKLFHGCNPGLLKMLVCKLKPIIFLPGDYICKEILVIYPEKVTFHLKYLCALLLGKESERNN